MSVKVSKFIFVLSYSQHFNEIYLQKLHEICGPTQKVYQWSDVRRQAVIVCIKHWVID